MVSLCRWGEWRGGSLAFLLERSTVERLENCPGEDCCQAWLMTDLTIDEGGSCKLFTLPAS
jgi:hypothetical protein